MNAQTMTEVPSLNMANWAYRIRVERFKKYEDPWSAMNKKECTVLGQC